MENKYLFEGSEWEFSLIANAMKELDQIAPELKLDIYPNQLEVITSEQMLDAYASVGLPVMYKHWSFGKQFTRETDLYRKGKRGLAYEMVLNTNPCINFLMEENSATTQVLVLAHAAYGHNHVFKNNYMFKQWTDAGSIVDYLVFAKNYIAECEEKYGFDKVEKTLDATHALMNFGVDRYNRPGKLSLAKEEAKQADRKKYLQDQVNELWKTVPVGKAVPIPEKKFLKEPEENILYFLEKKSPKLENWQREIIRIVRKIAQYFEPQRCTKVLNEGWASFTHYYMMHRLWDKGLLSDGSMLEFYQLHSNVLYQPGFDSKYYSGMNPYYLGFEIFTEIRRMCEFPTKEDEEYFPDLVGTPWVDSCLDAVANYRDESFIRQFLTPNLCRKMGLFLLNDDSRSDYLVKAIHNESGYKQIRKALADQYLTENYMPKIEIVDVDHYGSRKLTLMYYENGSKTLSEQAKRVLKYIEDLWGFPVELVNQDNKRYTI
jgi:stage V sporulation protein R